VTQHFIDLKDLVQDKVSVQGSFEPGVIDFSTDNIRQIKHLNWNATAERAGAEIRISGSVQTTLELPCSRCLEPAPVEVSKPFDLFFRQRDEFMFDEDDEIELKEKDTRTAFFTGTKLAIGDILREQVLLALPMKPLCKLDCKGLCPSCGTNLNIKGCNCPKEQFSPHLDTLLDIKRRLEERSS
jgi:uncharacterized protein